MLISTPATPPGTHNCIVLLWSCSGILITLLLVTVCHEALFNLVYEVRHWPGMPGSGSSPSKIFLTSSHNSVCSSRQRLLNGCRCLMKQFILLQILGLLLVCCSLRRRLMAPRRNKETRDRALQSVFLPRGPYAPQFPHSCQFKCGMW